MSRSPFLHSLAEYMLARRYSKRTVESYLHWIRAYIYFHNKQHPKELNQSHIKDFLTHLATNRDVAASTQKIALNALSFL